MIERFRDRIEAGQWLAKSLERLKSRIDAVFALPRGGVPVGFEVAHALEIPLEVFVVRKLGVPGHEEFAMGAIASGGVTLLNDQVISQLGISMRDVRRTIEREEEELRRREQLYGISRSRHTVKGQSIVLVDDGLATGSTMKVAVQALRKQDSGRITVAVPVAPASARSEFEEICDEFIAVLEPEVFFAVGQWYEDFSQTSDEEVRTLLAASHTAPA